MELQETVLFIALFISLNLLLSYAPLHVPRKSIYRIYLVQANKCLHVLRVLRKEGYSQQEIDTLFNSIVIPKITYGLSVYGASSSDLTTVQRFLDRCFKRKYTSKRVSIYDLLEASDMRIFKKLSTSEGHPLFNLLPRVNKATVNLRQLRPVYPRCNTERFKHSFINRLSYKYHTYV